MKRKTQFLPAAGLLAAMTILALPPARAESPALLLEKGVFAEETKGDIDAAIKIYKQIIDDAKGKANRKCVAQAMYRLGVCYTKQKKNDDAIVAFRTVTKHFADQKLLAQRAAKYLSHLAPPAAGDASRLPADVIAYMTDIHMAAYKKSQPKGLHVNSHIYGVDDQFNLHFGGLLAVRNRTDKVITGEIPVSNFSYADFEVMNETGAPQKIRFVDRKTSRGGRYSLIWTPDKPLKPRQVRLLGWKKKTTTKLTKATGGFQLTMKNHFGSPVLESFFLVLPPSVTIATKSKDYASRKRVGPFDVYQWRRTVPAKTTNTVELVLKTKGAGGSAARTPEQRASGQLAKRAWYLWNQRKLEESEKLFRQAVEKDPKNSDAWNGLGWALQNQGKAEATEAFKKCLALDPKNSGALNGMGWIAKLAGREDQAIAWWQKAVKANKHTTAALRGLTTTFMARGQYHQAAVCYAAWVKVDPNNKKIKAEMNDALAKAKVALAESKKAVAAAEKWLALLDEDKYAESWDESSDLFRKAIAKTKWTATIKGLMAPMGKVKSRVKREADYRTSLPGSPDGEYVVIIFKTTYANKKDAIETVTPMKDKDGKWRVSGYYIK